MRNRGTVTSKICPQHTVQRAVATSVEFTCYSVKAGLLKILQFSATPVQNSLRKVKRSMASPT
jgi:hypothetical protein